MRTPDLTPKEMVLELDYANRLLGVQLKTGDAKKLLERMRYDVKGAGKKLTVSVPAYRTDVLHPMDLVEDIAIAYGYQNFKPEVFKKFTLPKKDPLEEYSSKVRELMLGYGFQEVMTLIMTDRDKMFRRMLLKDGNVVETLNPVSEEHSVCRTWLAPSLLTVLEKNRNMEYPQKIFEVGDCVTPKGDTNRRLCVADAHSTANFSGIKAIFAGLMQALSIKEEVRQLEHGSFILGRCAGNSIGFFGELHPQVIENFGLEVPAAALEIDLDRAHDLS
ncbi:MAG: hypothetical protein V1921_01935 [Candidatus Altiarchaeota archaeon]